MGTRYARLPNIFSNNTLVSPLGIPLTTLDIVTIVVAIVLIVLLEIILRTTRTGVRMRAVADSTLLAALQRVHIPRFAASPGPLPACAPQLPVSLSRCSRLSIP